MQSEKAFLYCSAWPLETPAVSLDAQSVELQAYCLVQGLEVAGLGQDVRQGKPDRIREGLESLFLRAKAENVRHLVIQEPSRISLDPALALKILSGSASLPALTIHVAAWQTHCDAAETRRWLSRLQDWWLPAYSSTVNHGQSPIETLRGIPLRQRPLWHRVFGMLQDERYAEHLLRALFDLKSLVRLSPLESEAVHSGYDHLNMFQALGYRIKGERTENTRLVADVLTNHWVKAKSLLADELQRTIEGTAS